jgi:cystathionine gamma-synthase
LGTVLDPHPAFALGRGLKTLPIRIARHNANAMEVARFLDGDRRVTPSSIRDSSRIPITRSRGRR